MHCQHFRKGLSKKQKEQAAVAQSKKARKPFTLQVRDKKTQCPSHLTLVGQIPSKKQLCSNRAYLHTHKAVLKINFEHNHPILCAHTLSFRSVSSETKEIFFKLFNDGHSAASARHIHEQHLLMEAATDEMKQYTLADRAVNPSVQDICRLFQQWRMKHYGSEDGKPLFERLQLEVNRYNQAYSDQNGKAVLQWYEGRNSDTFDEKDDDPPPTKKHKRELSEKPLILALCTPLMARAHEYVCQAGELVFCDSSSSMDRFNTSIFLLSTHSVSSGIPLGIILTSDEREQTIFSGLDLLKSVIPENSFFGKGSDVGPDVIMIDDSSAERGALSKYWPQARILLCTFHFLQRQWTWLHEGKNQISKDDRTVLIKEVKALVYAESEQCLQSFYDNLLKNLTARKYPHFIMHLVQLWDKRFTWAHCYRKNLLIRGNHTNNYAEAGIKILKELVFSRVKAFNLVEMFTFVYDVMEMYYQKKLIAISNHRFETYIALRFQGLKFQMKTLSKILQVMNEEDEDIVTNSASDEWYQVRSSTERNTFYDVNVTIGVCTCMRGQDGAPCVHQAAVVLNYGVESLNYVATLSASARLKIATIALGSGAVKQLSFYSSLHQQAYEERFHSSRKIDNQTSDAFEGSQWDLIRSNADHFSDTNEKTDECVSISKLSYELDEFVNSLKSLLHSDDQQLNGVLKFLQRYKSLSSYNSTSRLASAFHQFGWVFGGRATAITKGKRRHGRRIAVQATAAGRRRGKSSRGKSKMPAGRPCYHSSQQSDNHLLPTRKEPKGKRIHSLQHNISKGFQNAGKW